MSRLPTIFGLMFLLGATLVWGSIVVVPFDGHRFGGLSDSGWAIWTQSKGLVEVGPVAWWRYWAFTRMMMVGLPMLIIGLIGMGVASLSGKHIRDWPRMEPVVTWLGMAWIFSFVALIVRMIAGWVTQIAGWVMQIAG